MSRVYYNFGQWEQILSVRTELSNSDFNRWLDKHYPMGSVVNDDLVIVKKEVLRLVNKYKIDKNRVRFRSSDPLTPSEWTNLYNLTGDNRYLEIARSTGKVKSPLKEDKVLIQARELFRKAQQYINQAVDLLEKRA